MIKQNSNSSAAYSGMGICLEKLGHYCKAKRYYKKFLLLNPFAKEKVFIKTRFNQLRTKKDIINLKLCK